MKYFKVQKGFGSDDFISIDETEVSKALRAQINGSLAIFKEGSVVGNHIISITPDWHREMGWNREHKLTSEDYAQIGDTRQREYRQFLLEESTNKTGKIKFSEEVKRISNNFKA